MRKKIGNTYSRDVARTTENAEDSFAAMALFEDWKRPTYVRDQYFNLVGEESETNRFPGCVCPDDGDEMSVDSCGYYEYAGYGLSEEAIEVMVNDVQ